MRRYDKIEGAGTRIFPDGKVKHGDDVYIYSTSWRVTLPPFCFYPWTTVAPVDRDFSKAVSFRWNRTSRFMLALAIHPEVIRIVRKIGLQALYNLALLSFVRGSHQPALQELAQWHKNIKREFPLAGLMLSVKSFAPVKSPRPDQVQWAIGAWTDITNEPKQPEPY